MPRAMEPVNWDKATAAILLPPRISLACGDGREICITGWHPHVVYDDIVRVTVDGFITRPKEGPQFVAGVDHAH